MIIDKIIHECRSCESQNIIKNGFAPSGKQKYICKDCGYNGVLNPQQGYSEEEIEIIINAYLERPSMRGISRIFGVSRNTLSKWLKKNSIQTKK
jgi:transposase-like protein